MRDQWSHSSGPHWGRAPSSDSCRAGTPPTCGCLGRWSSHRHHRCCFMCLFHVQIYTLILDLNRPWQSNVQICVQFWGALALVSLRRSRSRRQMHQAYGSTAIAHMVEHSFSIASRCFTPAILTSKMKRTSDSDSKTLRLFDSENPDLNVEDVEDSQWSHFLNFVFPGPQSFEVQASKAHAEHPWAQSLVRSQGEQPNSNLEKPSFKDFQGFWIIMILNMILMDLSKPLDKA